jgi:hypothetical protein
VKIVKLLCSDASALTVALCDKVVDNDSRINYVHVRVVVQRRASRGVQEGAARARISRRNLKEDRRLL